MYNNITSNFIKLTNKYNIDGYINSSDVNIETICKGFDLLGISNFIPPADEISTSYGLGLIIPLVEMVLLFLASLGINKDENLIKSLDRLR